MEIKKNDELIVDIEDISSEGEGIGKHQGFILFVKNTVVGDKVKIKVMKTKKSYGYARMMELLEASPFRVEARCPIAEKCGGCTLQHLDYRKQLEFKQNKVKNCLLRIGGFTEDIPMEPIVGMEEPFYYRNKAQFPVGKDKDGGVVIGFYAGRTHSIIDTSHCYIQAEINDIIIEQIRRFLEVYKISIYEEETHTGLVRHILTRVGFVTGELMVCLVINGTKLPHQEEFIEFLTRIPRMTSISLSINKEKTNVILGNKLVTIWGQPYITDYIGEIKYQISPLSFYQVNPIQTKKLYEIALNYADLHGEEVVWDLYCGIGTISLFLAGKAKQVYGVEIIPEAIEDARRNAEINGIQNAEFFVGAAEDILPRKYKEENIYADVIVVDPPRKGCDESLLDTIVQMSPKKVVYVSCDPATLARDLKYLCGRGYEVKRVQAVDQFGHSVHVEVITLLQKV
ncbi:MAG: rlmD [Lachnospiraceae bacterium]|jgi:23S rRNA (uracil1939-C5)-methyltransferase|nr:rlmD [Lachnospiraceae bacterium]